MNLGDLDWISKVRTGHVFYKMAGVSAMHSGLAMSGEISHTKLI